MHEQQKDCIAKGMPREMHRTAGCHNLFEHESFWGHRHSDGGTRVTPTPNMTQLRLINILDSLCLVSLRFLYLSYNVVTKNTRPPQQIQVLSPKPKYVLGVSQALGPLEPLGSHIVWVRG
ncbi:hypothetical protein TNCV_2467021 [Trichonephila clavipes]|nr:hypothetical protein TNCV_2467021 [Trichonephila clavipes]